MRIGSASSRHTHMQHDLQPGKLERYIMRCWQFEALLMTRHLLGYQHQWDRGQLSLCHRMLTVDKNGHRPALAPKSMKAEAILDSQVVPFAPALRPQDAATATRSSSLTGEVRASCSWPPLGRTRTLLQGAQAGAQCPLKFRRETLRHASAPFQPRLGPIQHPQSRCDLYSIVK